MTDCKVELPTFENLGVKPEDVKLSDEQAHGVATDWLKALESGLKDQQVEDLLIQDVLWRDMMALTWNMRTIHGRQKTLAMLKERVPLMEPSKFAVVSATMQSPFPDITWIMCFFNFETNIGNASGIVYLVPTPDHRWLAHHIYTNLESLKGHEEQTGPRRSQDPSHGHWLEDREREVNFEDRSPDVVIIGGGQSGLDCAARLKHIGVPSLILEANNRIGDNWRKRYRHLCLHDIVHYDHMPYLPFPAGWPMYSPSQKLGDWLETYSIIMELNIWLGCKVDSAPYDEESKTWKITVKRNANEPERVLRPKYLIIATGIGGGTPRMPDIANADKFKGEIVHSSKFTQGADYLGKKVVVVGACTSAHDICADMVLSGVEPTMVQRSSTYIMTTKNGWPVLFDKLYAENGPPTDVADRINASHPHHFAKLFQIRATEYIAQLDKPLLDALDAKGFKRNMGIDGSGFALLAWNNAGGYYLDCGASQMIVDGKITIKSGSVKAYSESGLEFEDGSKIDADAVVYATGYGDFRDSVRSICGDEIGDKVKPIWGLDEEGEIRSAWRDCGVDNLYVMMGNLALCRFHSSHVAMQIKAGLEGLDKAGRYVAT